MSRRRYSWDEKKISRYLHAGRGLGSGSEYKPWLSTADVPSLGRSQRSFWSKTRRVHHFLSDNEFYAFVHHAFDDDVLDIREQFPLDRTDTLSIAALLGIRHPVDRISGTPLVMTTDLLVTRRTPSGVDLFAYAVKEDKDLERARTVEKLEIERLYWAVRGVAWDIQLSSEVKNNTALNLEWVFDCDAFVEFGSAWLERIKSYLRATFHRYPVAPLGAACRLVDVRLSLAPGTALGVARALLARKELLVDLSLDPPLAEISCSKFSFAESRT
jgi:hypothetical protein